MARVKLYGAERQFRAEVCEDPAVRSVGMDLIETPPASGRNGRGTRRALSAFTGACRVASPAATSFPENCPIPAADVLTGFTTSGTADLLDYGSSFKLRSSVLLAFMSRQQFRSSALRTPGGGVRVPSGGSAVEVREQTAIRASSRKAGPAYAELAQAVTTASGAWALHETLEDCDLDRILVRVMGLYSHLSSGWVRDVPGAFALAPQGVPAAGERERMRHPSRTSPHIHHEIHRVSSAFERQKAERRVAIERREA